MEDKHLREEKSQIGYKFKSNNTVVVGRIDRLIGVRDNSASANQLLDKIQLMTMSLLREIGVVRSDDPIHFITPIAVYSQPE